jgi:thiol-disulfide isomerase/thioredoxin
MTIALIAAVVLSPQAPKAEVLVFVMPECPIAAKYAPELRRLAQEYKPKGVTFKIVHVDPDVKEPQARAFAKEYTLDLPFQLDPRHEQAKKAGIKAVPGAAVYAGGKLQYSGRIDDRFPRLGHERAAPQRRDLKIALDEVLAGKAVSMPRTDVVGCYLPNIG